MSHIAIVRSSARIAQHREMEASQSNTDRASITSDSVADNIAEELSQMSIISMTSPEASSLNHESTLKSLKYSVNQSTTTPMLPSIQRFENLDSLEACLDLDMHQVHVLEALEQKWAEITDNLDTVLSHLNECSGQVTEASTHCLQTLSESIDKTCDKVDSEVKALYHLMTRCDELTTKLSVASSFHDEIKTLKKSVETIENLYKSRPHRSQKPI